MTQYVTHAGAQGSVSASRLVIKPVTYEVRINRIEFGSTSDTTTWTFVVRHTGSTFSGGSVAGVYATRNGSSPATALARTGSVSMSSNASVVTAVPVSAGSFGQLGRITGAGTNAWEPGLDFTIVPGNTLEIDPNTSIYAITVYFEELKLSQSY